jgi:hypothetical protein
MGWTNYLDRMGRRLRVLIWARGTAAAIASALILTVVLAGIMAWVAPSPSSLVWCRVLLFLGVGITAVLALAVPLLRMSRRAVARQVERKFRGFDQRLLTFTERRGPADPLLPLLAEDALRIAQAATPELFVRRKTIVGLAAVGVLAGGALGWLVLADSGKIGDGAQVLWAARSPFRIEVQPGRRTVLRGSVIARLGGFTARRADLWVRYAGAAKWSPQPALFESEGAEFRFELGRLPGNAEFYVEAGGVRSPVAKVNVVDLPRVKSIAVTYPASAQEPTSGDVIAPAGTVARIEIETDRPMNGGELVLEEGDAISLGETQGNRTSANLTVLRDDGYHVSVMYGGEPVQVSGEHAIEVLMRDSRRRRVHSLVEGIRSGPVPAGYETAVAEYYRRLSAQAAGEGGSRGGR